MLNAEEGVRPLTVLVEVVVPQAECVLNSMLSTWYLVKDRHSKAHVTCTVSCPPLLCTYQAPYTSHAGRFCCCITLERWGVDTRHK